MSLSTDKNRWEKNKYFKEYNLPFTHVAPSNPVPVQLQEKVPGVLEHVPPLHGVPVLHSLISVLLKTRVPVVLKTLTRYFFIFDFFT